MQNNIDDIDVVIHLSNFELGSWQTHLDTRLWTVSLSWCMLGTRNLTVFRGVSLNRTQRNRCCWSILRHQEHLRSQWLENDPRDLGVLGYRFFRSTGTEWWLSCAALNLWGPAASILAPNLGSCNPFGRPGECSRGSTEVWWIALNKTCWELHCWWFEYKREQYGILWLLDWIIQIWLAGSDGEIVK